MSSGLGWELITGVGVATWVAHLYAEMVGDHVRHSSLLDRREITMAMADGLPILLAAVPPALMLLLGRLEMLDERVALWLAVGVAFIELVAVGVFVGSAVTTPGAKAWTFAAVTVAIGIVIVGIKVAFGH